MNRKWRNGIITFFHLFVNLRVLSGLVVKALALKNYFRNLNHLFSYT